MQISEIAFDKLPSRLFQSVWMSNGQQVLNEMPQPFGIVSLASENSTVSNLTVHSRFLLKRWIDDGPNGLLSDYELKSMVCFTLSQMLLGVNILTYCTTGQSRSAYFNAALLCEYLEISGKEAFEIIPEITNLQNCFRNHVCSLYPK